MWPMGLLLFGNEKGEFSEIARALYWRKWLLGVIEIQKV